MKWSIRLLLSRLFYTSILFLYSFEYSRSPALGWLRRSQTQHWVMYCVLIFLLKLSSVPSLNPVQRRVHAADIYPNVSAIGHRRYRCARPRRMPPKACRLHTPYSKCVQDITASVVAFFSLLFFLQTREKNWFAIMRTWRDACVYETRWLRELWWPSVWTIFATVPTSSTTRQRRTIKSRRWFGYQRCEIESVNESETRINQLKRREKKKEISIAREKKKKSSTKFRRISRRRRNHRFYFFKLQTNHQSMH